MQVPRSAALAAAVGLLAILPATATAKKVVALGHYAQRNLVSDQAGFITGQIIHVDGGMTRTGA